MNIIIVAGTRPNIIKISPIINTINKSIEYNKKIKYKIVHTGQHYDDKMSSSFFKQLKIPKPDINLEVGSGSQAEQTGEIMVRFERVLIRNQTDLIIVVGDVNSTLACTIVAKKLNIPVAHVEGGIRSGDLSMPEEINRIVTDSISNYFFTTTEKAGDNLKKSGIKEDKIYFVGNTMIDTLLSNINRIIKPEVWDEKKLSEGKYLLMTLHRPANVDQEQKLKKILNYLVDSVQNEPIIFPVHPRTRNILKKIGFNYHNLHYIDPLGYLEFIYMVKHARAVITDSGGITEESTVLGIPCLTLRDNTERPETITQGTNELIGTNPKEIKPAIDNLYKGNWKKGVELDKWDGKTSERIVKTILHLYEQGQFNHKQNYVAIDLLYKNKYKNI